MRINMAKELRCIMEGCDAVINDDSEDEIMKQAAVHAGEVHGLHEIDDATAQALRGAIRQS
jgi:predicted small metal-binding protein